MANHRNWYIQERSGVVIPKRDVGESEKREKPVICDECGGQILCRSNYRKYLLRVHGIGATKEMPRSVCSECRGSFETLGHAREHIATEHIILFSPPSPLFSPPSLFPSYQAYQTHMQQEHGLPDAFTIIKVLSRFNIVLNAKLAGKIPINRCFKSLHLLILLFFRFISWECFLLFFYRNARKLLMHALPWKTTPHFPPAVQ